MRPKNIGKNFHLWMLEQLNEMRMPLSELFRTRIYIQISSFSGVNSIPPCHRFFEFFYSLHIFSDIFIASCSIGAFG
jgi:hypothetical protein